MQNILLLIRVNRAEGGGLRPITRLKIELGLCTIGRLVAEHYRSGGAEQQMLPGFLLVVLLSIHLSVELGQSDELAYALLQIGGMALIMSLISWPIGAAVGAVYLVLVPVAIFRGSQLTAWLVGDKREASCEESV